MATGWTGINPAAWAENTEKRMTALLRNSVKELAIFASLTVHEGGNVPFEFGDLSRSTTIDTKPPVIDADGTKHPDKQDFSLGVADIVPGKPVYIGWTMNYARRQNYGFAGEDSLGRTYNQSGFGFAEKAAAQWPQIVIREAQKIAGREGK